MSASEVFDYRIIIKEHHLDTFGHVNNAIYLQMLEEARWELITDRGYGLKKIMEIKQGPVILDVNIAFRRELKLRENVTIKTHCTEYRGKIGKIKQVFMNEKGEEACIALLSFGLFDLATRKLIDPTPEWLSAIGMTLTDS